MLPLGGPVVASIGSTLRAAPCTVHGTLGMSVVKLAGFVPGIRTSAPRTMPSAQMNQN